MKWKTRTASSNPQAGDTRWTLKFAWVPKICNDGYTRWLCDVYAKQRYEVVHSLFTHDEYWTNMEYSGSVEDLSKSSTSINGEFSDIKSFEVIEGPGEVRYELTFDGRLRVYLGRGLSKAPFDAETATIENGFTTFIYRDMP